MSNRQGIIAIVAFGLLVLLLFLLPGCGGCGGGYRYSADPLADSLDDAVRHLADGKIAFESPLTMKLNETKVVEVRIARNLNQDLTFGLSRRGHVEVQDIQVGPLMAVSLNGSAFKITPLSKENQVVVNSDFTAWSWAVHPLDWGQQTLYVDVCVRLQLKDHKEEPRCSLLDERTIKVQVAPMYAATHFINNNATWTLGTAGACASGLFAGVWAWIKKRKGKQTVLEP